MQDIVSALEYGGMLRYGENPHQDAACWVNPAEGGIANAELLWGKPMGYNNYTDADAAWSLLFDLDERACAIVKHGTPCGAAQLEDPRDSFRAAHDCDPVSAYGGIIAVRVMTEQLAELITERGNFFEVIVALDYEPESVAIFQGREGWGQNVRLLKATPPTNLFTLRSISGGILIQDADPSAADDEPRFVHVTHRKMNDDEYEAARLQWRIVKHVKSNAIVVGTQDQMLGMGTGQPNRVQSVRLALEQAGALANDAALASDAYFPFPDSIEVAYAAGIRAIIQPGGSKKDGEVIAAANERGMAMIFTGVRHFRH